MLDGAIHLGADDKGVGIMAEPGDRCDPCLVGGKEALPLLTGVEADISAPLVFTPVRQMRLDQDS